MIKKAPLMDRYQRVIGTSANSALWGSRVTLLSCECVQQCKQRMAISCKHCAQRCASVVDADVVGIDLDEKCEILTKTKTTATTK